MKLICIRSTRCFSALLTFLVSVLVSSCVSTQAAAVIISEFVASNSTGLPDEDGDHSDWIELFNTSGGTVNLNGWYLTDNASNLTKWRLPATNLPPNGFLLVFASGKNRATPGLPLHANFSLSAGGEYLALVQPDGVTIATQFAPQFPEQLTDISYGLGQNVQVTTLVASNAAAQVWIATNGTLGTTWTATNFNATSWQVATNGVGFETFIPGFAVKNVRASSGVCDINTAVNVLAAPGQQLSVFTTNAATINYFNTGSEGHYAGSLTFPGLTINVDQDNFVTEATGTLTIPSSGNWTFGVNSDDGFRLTIDSTSFEYPNGRGPADSFQTFNLTAGEHSIRLVFFECGGGSEVELFATAGSYGSYNSNFRLIGDTANGGLAVKSLANSGGSSLRPLIATDVQAQMANRASSAYVRLPFSVANPAALNSLTLRMKYDDGFVAYLNGTEVARRNAPVTPLWNSVATNSQPATSAIVYEDFDLTSQLGLLKTNGNVLALHGMNDAINSTDFLILAELVENKVLGLTNQYFATPTPGAFNSEGSAAKLSDLEFNPKRGWYLNTNLPVTITSALAGVTIRYTTDGSAPSATNGLVYTGPVTVNRPLVLRAIGLRNGFLPSDVETHSYLLLDKIQQQNTTSNYVGGSSGDYTLNPAITQNPPYRDTFTNDLLSLPTVSIAMSSDELFGPNGIWSNTSAEGEAWERACSIEYLRPDGEKGFHLNCGIRLQGGFSRYNTPKHGLRLLFKSDYGPSKLSYDLSPDSSVQEFDTLVLHGGYNDHWLAGNVGTVFHRDQWCRDTQNAMGGYGPHGRYVHLYLNGIYWGVYNLGEKGDASYAAHYMGGDKSEYDALNSDELIDGTIDAWNAMFAIVNAGVTTDSAYTNLSQYLNLPSFMDYMMMNFYAGNTDWPGHNWNAARRRVPGATFQFFSWDAEWTFGLYLGGNNDDRTGVSDGAPGKLYNALRGHPEFQREFGDRVQKACFNSGVLTPAVAVARWNQRSMEMDRAMVGETARWGSSRETWLSSDEAVRGWFTARNAVLVNQLRNAGLYPTINAPGLTPFGGLVPPNSTLTLTNPNGAGTIYYTLDGSDPRLWGGNLSGAAKIYSSPLVVTNAGILRARIRNGTTWSALIEAPFYILQDFSGLAVTELMYHPPALGTNDGDELEFLELKNSGTNTLDLSGLQFDAGITFTFTNGTLLPPNQFAVLVRNPALFATRYPGVAIKGVYTGKLDNAGEKLTLDHVLGTNIFSFSYGTTSPWPITPDGYGFSLVRANLAGAAGAAASWRASANQLGSPGADDPAVNIPAVVINELLTHTDLPQVDAIELFNPTPGSVNIGGWFLSDDPKQPKKFRISNGTTIPANGYIVFTETNFNAVPGVSNSFRLSSWGEPLLLLSGDANTNLTGYSHSVDYGTSANGVSFGRYVISTGEEFWPAQSALTLGATNSGPRLGPLVINEIQYHPPAGFDEYVEIYNLSGSPVALYDPAYPTNTWRLAGADYFFPTNITLAAGGYLIVSPIAPATFRAKYSVPASVPIYGPYSGTLQDSGERLSLERPDSPDTNGVPYIVVDEVRYNDKAPWPVSADGDGPSLQRRIPASYGNEPTNWFASGISAGVANSVNQAPTCSLTTPTSNATFAQPANIPLSAVAADADGSITRVEFFDGVIKLGEVTGAPYNFIWSNAPAGGHSLTARARDNRLAITESAPVMITVIPPPIGTGTGLIGNYYNNVDFTGALLQRIDPQVNFNWGDGSPDASMEADSFSVRWIGQVQPRFSETYNFYTICDDGSRLWVNDQLLVNDWNDHAATEQSGIIALQAGRLYKIKLEFYEAGGGAVAQLAWASPSVTREFIPATQLYPVVDEDGDGLPDDWETTHGLNPTVNDAALDPDHDGMSNWQEFLAGTDPQNAQSVLRLDLANSPTGVTLQLNAAANHSYGIQWRTNLVSGSWSNLMTISAENTDRQLNLPANVPGSPVNYFRVVTPAP